MTTHRRSLVLPDGWTVTRHSTVQVLDSTTLHPVDVPVAGRWRSLERAPDGGWWLQPADETSTRWLAAHGRRVGASSGMVNVHAHRLAPWWLQLRLPGT